ncbi:MAG: flagellar hook-basal body complex protein [Clostridia bacterium]
MSSAAGLEAQTAALTATDDNLANLQSNGFLALVTQTQAWAPEGANRVTPGETAIGGPIPEGVAASTTLSTAPSPYSDTGNPLDVALPGLGFLAVQTAKGTAYTRNGALQVAPNGLLTDTQGHPVLSTTGTPLTIPPGTHVALSANGTVTANGIPVGTMRQVTLGGVLTALGGDLYTGAATPVANAQFIPGAVNQGANISLTTALDALVQAQSAYGADASSWHVDTQVRQQGDQLAQLP